MAPQDSRDDDTGAAADRLARALERIAASAGRPGGGASAEPGGIADREIILARLDRLIAQVRAALGPQP